MWIFKNILHLNYYAFCSSVCFLLWCLDCFGSVLKFGNVSTQHKALHNQISCENLNLVMLLSFLCETIKWMCCNRTHSGNGSSVKILEAQSNNNVFKFLKHEVVACYKFLKCNIVKIQETWGAWWLCIWMGVGVCAHENELFWWMSITLGYQAFFWNCKLPPIFRFNFFFKTRRPFTLTCQHLVLVLTPSVGTLHFAILLTYLYH